MSLTITSLCWADEDIKRIVESREFIFNSNKHMQNQRHCLPHGKTLVKVTDTASSIDGVVNKPIINVFANVEENCVKVTANVPQKVVCTEYPVILGIRIANKKKCITESSGVLKLRVTYEATLKTDEDPEIMLDLCLSGNNEKCQKLNEVTSQLVIVSRESLEKNIKNSPTEEEQRTDFMLANKISSLVGRQYQLDALIRNYRNNCEKVNSSEYACEQSRNYAFGAIKDIYSLYNEIVNK